jgi:hypothetical protein
MIAIAPRYRSRAVRSAYREGIKSLLAISRDGRRVPGSQGLFSFEASSLAELPAIPRIGPAWIESIEGLRRKTLVSRPVGPRTYALKVRMVEQIAGKIRGRQHVDERTVIVRAATDRAARSKVERHFARAGYATPYVDPSGNPVRWRVESIGNARAIVIDPLGDGVTTVWTEGSRRTLQSGSIWRG